jgi:hypothetical protein
MPRTTYWQPPPSPTATVASAPRSDYAPRPSRLWITETEEARRSGEMEFTGYAIDGTAKTTFFVDPRATED